MSRKHTLLSLALLGLATTSAQAVLVTASFTATGFTPFISDGSVPPTDPVSGSFTYNAASLGATIDSLVSISLTIDGHTYTLAETDFLSPLLRGFSPDQDLVFGSIGGDGILSGTNDFWIRFDRVAGTGLSFFYSSTSFGSNIFETTRFSSFSLTTGTVPEPGTVALALLALGAAGWAGRRKAA